MSQIKQDSFQSSPTKKILITDPESRRGACDDKENQPVIIGPDRHTLPEDALKFY